MKENKIKEESINNIGSKKLGVASFVLGIISLVMAILMPWMCLLCGILSIIFSIVSKKASMATAGMVLGIVGTVFSSLFCYIDSNIGNNDNNVGSIITEIVSDEVDPRSKIIGTWYGAGSLSSLEKGDYSVVFILDEDYNFTWGKYGDLKNNKVEGKYTFKDLEKTNYSGNTSYYEVEIKGENYYMNGNLQHEEYGNTYEFGVVNTGGKENSGVIASHISGSMYYLKKIQ